MLKKHTRLLAALSLLAGSLSSWAASPGYKDTLVVARDGTGDYRTLTEAFEHCRAYMDYTVYILVKKGYYKEKLIVPSWLENIVIEGEDVENTVITWDDHANIGKMGTFRSYTVRVDGNAITFRNISIENSAPPMGQAVALHTEGDRLVFVGCRILGNQDTVFTGRREARLYFGDCYIEGTTDFIFGPATAWFENCTIHCKRNSFITAASTPADVKFGYVFNKCRVTYADDVTNMKLGRPWRDYAYTVFMNCDLGDRIAPEGWIPWNVPHPEQTVRYAEYGCTGTSADTSRRVSWARRLTKKEAAAITLENVFPAWQPQTATRNE